MAYINFWRVCFALTLSAIGFGAAADDRGAQLLEASGKGDTARVRQLLAAGAPLEARDGQGNTPLLRATQGNHAAAAAALIQAGADVNAKNGMQDSAYLLAGAQGDREILELTLTLQAGVDPNHVNRLGWTGLLEAIILSDGGPRHQAIVGLLIEGGADVNLPDKDGRTPLQHARQRGQTEIVQMLERARAR
ncbi:ankyrin repeat domain-containing protein [Achromobacter mucicolens]|uniref:ankyrin repeat domain-containing protein n=1 Tax=Achromobacter mucicolens TaxID=1389922 RepID=UPI00289B2E00|nr:ankyrin repeat domain-containing protein [Achromobacter mucicolens]